MPFTHNQDPEFLQAALIGFQHTLASLDERIAELRSQLGGQPVSHKAGDAAPAVTGSGRRTMSASARKRIALAQKKRWAAYNAAKGKPAAASKAVTKTAAVKTAPAKAPKRTMSAEGRARIVAATKKRWAAFHKAQQAPKPAAKKKAAAAPPVEAPAPATE